MSHTDPDYPILCRLFGHKLYYGFMFLGQSRRVCSVPVMKCSRKSCEHIEDRKELK